MKGDRESRVMEEEDSEGSLSWEDFFGNSSTTDLVPTLLGMYDALIGRADPEHSKGKRSVTKNPEPPPPPAEPPPAPVQRPPMEDPRRKGEERPLSVTSIASSSSSASSASSGSSSNRGRSKSCAYLASVESLGDDELSVEEERATEDRRTDSGAGSVDDGKSKGFSRSSGVVRNQRAHHSYPQHHRLGRRLFLPTAPPSTAASSTSGVSSATSSSSSSSSSFPTTTCSHISSPSLPTGPKPRYCDPHLSYMDRVVMEISETEAIYVRDLQQVIEGYLHRWRSSPDCPIGPRQLQDLFGNIEDIYQFNSGFLGELEQCGLDPVKVAKTFVKNNAGFSIYTDYCTNYPRTVSVLTELMRQDMTVRLFRERQGALQHTLPLGSYLLKPVQRILKYHLLLQNIVKHFGKDSEGYRDIADALSAMTGIAHHINEMKRRHEHAIRVQEIQSLLYGWEGEDLTTFGELCAEGAFRMHGAKALRHAFLFDRMLLLTKRKEEGMLTYKAHILCSNLMLIESVPGEPLSFHVIPFDNPRLQYTLQARNLEQKREWTLQLKRVILENYNAVIPTHARQLVMELGQNRTDDEIMAEKSSSKKQHSAPEYLERRKQERRKSETVLLLRSRLRRSHRKEGTVVPPDGLSSKEQSPAVHRRGRRAQSVSQDRGDSSTRNRKASDVRADTLPSTAEKVKDRFGSWRRKSEPSYSSKSSSPRGHLSIYVSPDFIERSTDSLVEKPRKDECTADEDNSYDEIMTGVSKEDHSGNLEDDMDINENKSSKESLRIESPSPSQGNEEECHEESLEEIVGQLVRQSRQFQRMLMKQHQKSRGGSASRSRNHSREHQRSDENSLQNGYSVDDDAESMRNSPCVPDEEALDNQKQNSNSNTFRAQRQAHMRALREEQKMSSIPKISLQNESSKKQSDDYMSLSFSEGVLKKADDVPIEGITPSDDARKSSNINDNYFGNYDNLQNVWESVRKAEKEKREAAALGENPLFTSHKEESPSWSPCGIAPHMGTLPCIPTLPAVWLKQQEGHLATPNLKSGSLPRGFQLGQSQRQLPQPQAQRCSAFDVSPSSTLSHPETCSHNDEGYSSSMFRMERPFTIASESPGRADEIDFEDIEQYMAETGRSGVGMSFLPPRFPLPPLQDTDGQEVAQEDDDEEDEEVVDENSSTAHINVHPEYRVYRPIVSKAALRHVISSVSSKLANLRVGISSGGITTEDEEEVEEGEDEYPGERTNTRGRSRRRMGNSFSSSTESNIAYGTRGHVSGGESESEAGKSGSRLVYTLARQYSKSLKERIRSIMTMNVVGVNNAEEDTDCFKEGESENQMSDNFMSQDSLNLPNTNNRTSPVKNTSPPVTYHKQGSSSLGARIAHGGDAAEYATPHIRGITDRVNQKESISPRPDSLLSATSSAFTSSSDGDKVTCNQESRIINLEPCSEGSDSSRKMNSEEEDDDNEDCGGSGDSYYERSFEAIESFLGDPSMTCTIVGDTFRDSAIFSDHEEIELIMSRVTETSKTFLQPTKPTPVRTKIPPPVPAKPSASSIALATSVAQSAQCMSSVNGGDQNCNEVHQVLRCSTLERTQPSHVNAQQNSTVQNQLLGVKSVKERRKELEMWRNSMDVSGCCEKGAVDVPKHTIQKMEQSLDSGRPGAFADKKTGAIQDIECEEGGATPKGWVRHVIGKLQGD